MSIMLDIYCENVEEAEEALWRLPRWRLLARSQARWQKAFYRALIQDFQRRHPGVQRAHSRPYA